MVRSYRVPKTSTKSVDYSITSFKHFRVIPPSVPKGNKKFSKHWDTTEMIVHNRNGLSKPLNPTADRPRFQFGLSRALVVISIMALVAAWFGFERRLVRERRLLASDIFQRGGSVYTAADLAMRGQVNPFRQWLGDEPISTIYLPPPDFTDKDFSRARAAFPEAHVFPAQPLTSG